MQLVQIRVYPFVAPHTGAFRSTGKTRSDACSIIVEVEAACGTIGYGEGCPRADLNGETTSTALAFLASIRGSIIANVASLADLYRWIYEYSEDIDANPAAFCAIELAVLDLLGKLNGVSLEALLSVAPLGGVCHYTADLGDLSGLALRWRFGRDRYAGYRDFRITLSGERRHDRARLAQIRPHLGERCRLRVGIARPWVTPPAAISYLAALELPLLAIEEPLLTGNITGNRDVGDALGTPIILGDSLFHMPRMSDHFAPDRWIVRIDISRLGGLIRALALTATATRLGCRVIVGAEDGATSILTRTGLTIAMACGDELLAMEGAAAEPGRRQDIARPDIVADRGGTLRPAATIDPDAPGLGLHVTHRGKASVLTERSRPKVC